VSVHSVDIRDPTSNTNTSDDGGDARDDDEDAVTQSNQYPHHPDLVSTESTGNDDLSDDKTVNSDINAGESDVSFSILTSCDRNYGSCQSKQETPEQPRQVVTDWKDS
jgi:hypothetical protein